MLSRNFNSGSLMGATFSPMGSPMESPATPGVSPNQSFSRVNNPTSPGRVTVLSPGSPNGSPLDPTWRRGPNPASPTTTRVTVTPFDATTLASPRSQAFYALTSPQAVSSVGSLGSSPSFSPNFDSGFTQGSPAILQVGSAPASGTPIQAGFFSPSSNLISPKSPKSPKSPSSSEYSGSGSVASDDSADSVIVSGSLLAQLLTDPKYAESILQLARDNGLSDSQINRIRQQSSVKGDDNVLDEVSGRSVAATVSPAEMTVATPPQVPYGRRGRSYSPSFSLNTNNTPNYPSPSYYSSYAPSKAGSYVPNSQF